MIVILSPAKNMKMRKFENYLFEEPMFKEKAMYIHKKVRNLQPHDIESLMKVSRDIAFNTFCNFQDFDIEQKNAHALYSYEGLVFKNIDATNFTKSDINFAKKHIKILSGLYGMLSATTNISPYRLEIGLKTDIFDEKNLYKYWDRLIYDELFKGKDVVLNLASKEYTKTITPFLKKDDIFINVHFICKKDGKHKVIPTLAKILRGQMVKYIVKNKIKNVKKIKEFCYEKYFYNEYLSDEKNFVFLKNKEE